MSKNNYKKSEIALIQLERAIILFGESDYVSSITLAGASGEIFEEMCIANNIAYTVSLAVEKTEGFTLGKVVKKKDIQKVKNKTKNELKHHDTKEDNLVEADFAFEAELLIVSAIQNYKKLFGSEANNQRIIDFVKDYKN